MRALHFLKEDHVGPHLAHRLAQFAQNEATVQEGEALVGVHREHAQGDGGTGAFIERPQTSFDF